jgi:hypothetical protein
MPSHCGPTASPPQPPPGGRKLGRPSRLPAPRIRPSSDRNKRSETGGHDRDETSVLPPCYRWGEGAALAGSAAAASFEMSR